MRKKEVEIVKHTHMPPIEIFVVEMTARGPHGHDDLEVGILLQGTLNLHLEHGSFLLHTGDIYVINRFQVHSFSKTAEQNRILAFQVNTDLYRKITPVCNDLSFTSSIIHSGFLHTRLTELLYACAEAYFSNDKFSALKCSSLFLDALYLLLTHSHYEINSERESSAAQNKTLRLNRITDYIAAHYQEPVTLADLAEQEGITPCHLSHFMTETLGISFQEYLGQVRFEQALHLLNETALSILDICMETGFSSSRYLNRRCMKSFGCTARAYRLMREKPPLKEAALAAETIERRFSFEQSKWLFLLRPQGCPSQR